MLYLFDLDGTLISSYMDNPDKAYHQWQVLPGRVERLAAIRAAGDRVGVITNQAGAAFGLISEVDFHRKWEQVCAAFGWNHEIFPIAVCYHHPNATVKYYQQTATRPYHDLGADLPYTEVERRKPSGKMIRELADEDRRHYGRVDTVCYIGDQAVDEQAAADAGVPFMWADEFFREVVTP